MRNWYFLVLLVAVAVGAGLVLRPNQESEPDVEREELHWYKGNTHTHSLWSDGNDFPEMIVSWYREAGYDFLTLSDHNILSRGEKWMSVAAVEKRKQVVDGPAILEKYRAKFGADWVELRGEGEAAEVRLKTLAEIRPRFEEPGEFLLVEGEEITDRFRNHQIHINAINLDEVIPPQKGASVVETVRNNLRMVEEQSKRLGRPILAHLNHPNFHYSFTAEQLAEVVEEQFFEVYNGHPGINHLGDESRPGDEALWDLANVIRITELEAPPLYGVATDDSHYYHGGNVSPGRGWVMVRSAELEAGALIEAMKRGEFYASSGVVLEVVSYREGTCALRIVAQEGARFTTRFIGTRKDEGAEAGEVLSTVEGLAPSYRMTGDELYVRAVVTSSRLHPNPSFPEQMEQAWTQPVGWKR